MENETTKFVQGEWASMMVDQIETILNTDKTKEVMYDELHSKVHIIKSLAIENHHFTLAADARKVERELQQEFPEKFSFMSINELNASAYKSVVELKQNEDLYNDVKGRLAAYVRASWEKPAV